MAQKFCTECGAPIEDESQRFCTNCGAVLEQGAPAAQGDMTPHPSPAATPSPQGEGGYPENGDPVATQRSGCDDDAAQNQPKKKTGLIAGIAAAVVALIVAGVLLAQPKELKGISLSRTSLTLERGETSELSYTITPSKFKDASVTWSSSDEDVATVEDGEIETWLTGTCEITATTANGKTATCTVTVVMPESEKKLVGTWNAISMLDLDTMDSFDWRPGYGVNQLVLNDDNSGYYQSEDTRFDFYWGHSYDDSTYGSFYATSEDYFYFILPGYDDGQLWFYIKTDTVNYCITLGK